MHSASYRRADCGQSAHSADRLDSAARHDRDAVEHWYRSATQHSGRDQPWRADCNRGGTRVHRRHARSLSQSVRRGDGTGAVESPPPCRRQSNSNDLSRRGRTPIRSDRGGRRWQGMGTERRGHRVRPSRESIVQQVSTRFDSERDTIETALEQICADYLSDLPPSIAQAIEYALRSPGKRLRPLLSIFAYRACGGDRDVTRLACAPEIIHSYSLVHDDLPCMDDDDMRRGRPTTHRVHGARAAIIAGGSMIPLAVTAASDALSSIEASPVEARRAIGALLSAAGAGGMI